MSSLIPSLGRIVIVATPEGYNGATQQVAIITRVHTVDADPASGRMGVVNLMVLPDMNVPYGKESVTLYHTPGDAATDTGLSANAKCWWPERV